MDTLFDVMMHFIDFVTTQAFLVLMQGNDAGANEDNSVAFVDNVGSAKDDASNGKDDEVEPASDVGKNIEGLVPDGLTIVSVRFHGATNVEINNYESHLNLQFYSYCSRIICCFCVCYHLDC